MIDIKCDKVGDDETNVLEGTRSLTKNISFTPFMDRKRLMRPRWLAKFLRRKRNSSWSDFMSSTRSWERDFLKRPARMQARRWSIRCCGVLGLGVGAVDTVGVPL